MNKFNNASSDYNYEFYGVSAEGSGADDYEYMDINDADYDDYEEGASREISSDVKKSYLPILANKDGLTRKAQLYLWPDFLFLIHSELYQVSKSI